MIQRESRVKLSLHGFSLNALPDMKRIDALVSFARPPPGVGNLPIDLTVLLIASIPGIRVCYSQ